MEKSTKTFLNIDGMGLNRECAEFLCKRLESPDYRGWHYSQHNRYTFDDVIKIFDILHEFIQEDFLIIRTTDSSKRPQNYPEERLYSDICKKIREAIGKGTQDSIRKNFFVDFDRMKLLERCDREEKKIEKGSKSRVYKVKISDLGIKLIQPASRSQRYKFVYSKAVGFLVNGAIDLLTGIMRKLGNFLEVNEFQFFVSFIGERLDERIYDSETITNFILKDYRKLEKGERKLLKKKIKEFCCNTMILSKNKKEKRDFENWRNATWQLFHLLDTTTYFEFDKREEKLRLRRDFYKDRMKRSDLEKRKYFDSHHVTKKKGFELHHIIPLSWSEDEDDFKLYDDWKIWFI